MSDRSDDALAATAVAAPPTSATTNADATARPDRPRDSQVMLEIGQKLDRYEIRGYLGEGGMGAVYRAFDTVLGTEVALKVLRNELASLKDEVRIAQQVTHENVCRTYDLEDVGGYQLVKMEYIAGDTLAARIAEKGALPIDEALRIAREIVRGLETAHARGIVHRDIKPGNVMLAGERVVLMDFGLARHVDDELDRAGTPGYMSPEQLAGGRVDTRSDLYALGCLLYEMLTGERAFAHGSMTEVAARRASQPLPDLRAKRALPAWLHRATQLLMSNDPEERKDGLRLLVSPPRRKRLLWIGAFALVALVIANAIYIWKLRQPSTPVSTADWHAVPIDVTLSKLDRPALSPDGKQLALVVDPMWLHDGTLGIVPFPAGGKPTPVAGAPQGVHSVRWRKDGSFVLGIDTPAGPRVGVLANGHFTEWGIGHDPTDCGDAIVAFDSADYPAIESPHGDALIKFSAPNAKPQILVPPTPYQGMDHPRCDSRGTRVVYSVDSDHPGIRMFDGKRVREVTNDLDFTPTFTRDDKSVLYAHGLEPFHAELFMQADGMAIPKQLTTQIAFACCVDPAPDGSFVFITETYDPAIFIHDANGPQLVTEHAEDLSMVFPTRDMKALIAMTPDAIVRIDLGGGRKELAKGAGPALSHDGKSVYYAARSHLDEMWSVPIDGGAPTKIAKLPGELFVAADGPDGLHVVAEAGGDFKSYRIDHATHEIIPEGDQVLVIPAPSGDWTATETRAGATVRAGDKKYDLGCIDRLTWLDATHAGCTVPIDGDIQLVVLDVTTGEKHVLTKGNDWDHTVQLVVGYDGQFVVIRRVQNATLQHFTRP